MAATPPNASPGPLERLRRAPGSFAGLSRTQRELIVLGAAVGFGVLVMPFLVWLAGNRALGPYGHGETSRGGPWALFTDYVVGLAHGSAVFWLVALGPALLVLLIRGFLALLRSLPPARGG
jgi:hypothetical protein